MPFVAGILQSVRSRYPGLDEVRAGHEFMRRQITAMVEDVIGSAQARLATLKPSALADIHDAGIAIVAFSPVMQEADRQLKKFLFVRMYRHPDVVSVRKEADLVLDSLFDACMADPSIMGRERALQSEAREERARARIVCDYLAGMTDTYAIKEYERLFDRRVVMG